jgi:hypothetical protein
MTTVQEKLEEQARASRARLEAICSIRDRMDENFTPEEHADVARLVEAASKKVEVVEEHITVYRTSVVCIEEKISKRNQIIDSAVASCQPDVSLEDVMGVFKKHQLDLGKTLASRYKELGLRTLNAGNVLPVE